MKHLVVFLLGFYLNAQQLPVVYVDENFQKIPKTNYLNKQESGKYLEAEILSDTAVYKKLFYKQFFGKLDAEKKSQLNKLLYQKYKIDSTKVWVIHYTDSLPDVAKLPKRDSIIHKTVHSGQSIIESGTESKEKIKRTKHYYFSYNSWYTSKNKELKKYRKRDHALLLHFYDYNAGFPETDREVKWHQDPYGIFKNIFSDGVKNYATIILHPDGDFFVSYYSISFDLEKELTDKDLFNKLKTKQRL